MKTQILCLSALLFAAQLPAALADPFKLGVQENGFLPQPQQGQLSYPAPTMTGPMQGYANQNQMSRQDLMPQRQAPPPLMGGVARQVVLPPVFMGAWNVSGQRTAVQAQPEFQQSAQGAFAGSTNNIWQISGNPQGGYAMSSNTGISTALYIDKVENNTAYLRYQHPIGKTMAREEIVMQLMPGGRQFQGLERISIVKEGLAQPRAVVSYQLFGTRQN